MSHITLSRRSLLRLAGASSVSAAGGFAFGAEPYPARPIRIVVPFTAGGGEDVVGRAARRRAWPAELGQAIVINDKKAGGGTVGSASDLVAKSPPDGYTLLMTTSALAINASLSGRTFPGRHAEGILRGCPDLPRPQRAGGCARDSPIKTLQDVIDAAREKPGKLNYASSGNGSAVRLAAELFKNMAKIDLTHVPLSRRRPGLHGLAGRPGRHAVRHCRAAWNKFVESGKMRAIAVTSRGAIRRLQGCAGHRRDAAGLCGGSLVRGVRPRAGRLPQCWPA